MRNLDNRLITGAVYVGMCILTISLFAVVLQEVRDVSISIHSGINTFTNESHSWTSSPKTITITDNHLSSVSSIYWKNTTSNESYLLAADEYSTSGDQITLTCGS